jgi:DedD protein
MEKKKLLLVAVSVGVVLLIILIIPLLIISPRKDFGGSWQEQSSVIEPPNLTQGWESADEPEQQAVDTKPEESTYVAAAPVTPKAVEQSNVTTLSIPAPRSVAVPDAVISPAKPAAKPVQPIVQENNKEAKHQAAKAAAAKPAAAKPAAAPAAAQKAEKPKAVKNSDNSFFWIQTGAFTTMKHAEGAKSFLAERGITSIIEDPEINGKTWYRVRVGPYTTRDEANYWLALVKAIDGFSSSQVWETAAR